MGVSAFRFVAAQIDAGFGRENETTFDGYPVRSRTMAIPALASFMVNFLCAALAAPELWGARLGQHP
jgi:hypothetical protein